MVFLLRNGSSTWSEERVSCIKLFSEKCCTPWCFLATHNADYIYIFLYVPEILQSRMAVMGEVLFLKIQFDTRGDVDYRLLRETFKTVLDQGLSNTKEL